MNHPKTTEFSGNRAKSPAAVRGGRPSIRSIQAVREKEAISSRLESISDRPDLERLFDRNVGVSKIMRLMARSVSREQIQELLASEQFERDLKKLLR